MLLHRSTELVETGLPLLVVLLMPAQGPVPTTRLTGLTARLSSNRQLRSQLTSDVEAVISCASMKELTTCCPAALGAEVAAALSRRGFYVSLKLTVLHKNNFLGQGCMQTTEVLSY